MLDGDDVRYLVVGIGLAFLFGMALWRPWNKENPGEVLAQTIGASVAVGLFIVAPALFFLGGCIG